MTDPKLALQARWIRCRALAWACVAEACCLAATAAFSRQREADGCARLVAARAEGHTLLPTHQQPQSLTKQGIHGKIVVPPALRQQPGDVPGNPQGGSRDD